MIPAPARRLLDFIGSKEAPRGYDTVYANKMAQMPRPITAMTVDEVIADGPRRTKAFGSSACGRYQFMTATLKGLRQETPAIGRMKLTPDLQDELGLRLLRRRGLDGFLVGATSTTDFGLRLAQEWASFPVLRVTKGAHRQVYRGQSYYQGDALNKALVSADEVERFLNTLRAEPTLTVADPPVVIAPRAEIVPAPEAEDLPWWARLLGRKPKAAAPADGKRPGLHPRGSAALWDVQKALRDRNYYTDGLLDGLDGKRTRTAVAEAREDNGLGKGGIDQVFLAALPTMPLRPVAATRAGIGLKRAAQHRPEVFNPLKWVATLGASTLGIGVGDSTGLFDQLQSGAARVNDVAGSVQSVFGLAAGVVGFVVDHRGILLVLLGLYLLFWAGGKVLDAWIKVRQAFF
ncbi:muramidase (phage lysozyme) [Methylobacterium sp. RAS18]|nr:muramidase (phage lysozyme) [Methylobacterium sp. RAS18]